MKVSKFHVTIVDFQKLLDYEDDAPQVEVDAYKFLVHNYCSLMDPSLVCGIFDNKVAMQYVYPRDLGVPTLCQPMVYVLRTPVMQNEFAKKCRPICI